MMKQRAKKSLILARRRGLSRRWLVRRLVRAVTDSLGRRTLWRLGRRATAAARPRLLTLSKALLGWCAAAIDARVRTLAYWTHRTRGPADAVGIAHVDSKLLALGHGHFPGSRGVLRLLQRVKHVTYITLSCDVWRVWGLAPVPVDPERLALRSKGRCVDLKLTTSLATTLLLDSAATLGGIGAAAGA